MSCLKTLKAKGLKVTPQRRIIVEAIHNSTENITAETIITAVQSSMPEVHKSTIYRNLDLLEKAGCVFKSEVDNHIVYHHADEGHHYHLICKKCGKTIECDDDIFKEIEKGLADRYDFDLNLKHVVLEGLCRDCKKD